MDPTTREIEYWERELSELRGRLEAGRREGRIHELGAIQELADRHEERLRVLRAAVAEARSEGERHGHLRKS